MDFGYLKSETVASQSFFSPVRVNYPLVLTRQELIMELYCIDSSKDMRKVLLYKEGNNIYDYHWLDPSHYIVLVKDHPIVLRSSKSGKILSKFPIRSHLDEIKSPYTAHISNNTLLTILGNTLHKIDFNSSTHSSSTINLPQFRPRTVTTAISSSNSLISLGSYNTSSFLLDTNSLKPIKKLDSLHSVNQFIFAQNLLYIGACHSDFIQIWDLRQLNSPLIHLPRAHPTHQKILFDVDLNNNVGIGNADGSICLFNHKFELFWEFFAHFDAVNSVQFFDRGLVTSSGQWHIGRNQPKSLIREFYYN